MSIGYACLVEGVADTKMKSCRIKNASEERLLELIAHNLQSLENIMDYNIQNNIKLFRVSSDIIPFGSSPVNKLKWWDIFHDKFTKISKKISENNIRISVHPGQYTVLNSNTPDVVQRAILDLNYHTKLLRCLGGKSENKIILHIGGVYGDKPSAIKRFIENYKRLNSDIKEHLVIENDDKSYTIEDVLGIGEALNMPVVFDNLHHAINASNTQLDDIGWIKRCGKTWKAVDGRQKIHYSQQDPEKNKGAHSKTIDTDEFIAYYNKVSGKELDIMLEVKDKNLSAVKCIERSSYNDGFLHEENKNASDF